MSILYNALGSTIILGDVVEKIEITHTTDYTLTFVIHITANYATLIDCLRSTAPTSTVDYCPQTGVIKQTIPDVMPDAVGKAVASLMDVILVFLISIPSNHSTPLINTEKTAASMFMDGVNLLRKLAQKI